MNNLDEDKNIKEALEEVELYQKGKLNLETWKDFKRELDLDEYIKIIEDFLDITEIVLPKYSTAKPKYCVSEEFIISTKNILKTFISYREDYNHRCQLAIDRAKEIEKLNSELANSISNVLSELNKYQEAHKILVNLNSNLKSQLETQINNTHILQSQLDIANAEKIEWKKIAEKLAEEMVLHGICSGVEESDKCYANEIQCGKCIIDWVRKEVEKGV